MTEYRITWEIDIEAETPTEAVLAAQIIQCDPNSLATVFLATPLCVECKEYHHEDTQTIDLAEKEGKRVH